MKTKPIDALESWCLQNHIQIVRARIDGSYFVLTNLLSHNLFTAVTGNFPGAVGFRDSKWFGQLDGKDPWSLLIANINWHNSRAGACHAHYRHAWCIYEK